MGQKLSNSVSVQEMLTMRERGMTNRQIAESLECCYATVLQYIGKQPAGLRAEYGEYAHKKEEVETERPPVLTKISCIETYLGEDNKYRVDKDFGRVTVTRTSDGDMTFDKSKLEKYITELLDVLSML